MAKIIGNTTTTPMAIPDWNQTDTTKADYIKNKPVILTEDDVIDLISENGSGTITNQIQSDWAQTDPTKVDYIKNKPVILTEDAVTDQTYNPESENAQSGKAVAEAVRKNGSKILDYITYEIANNQVEIVACDTSISGQHVIPETIEGYPVAFIRSSAFDNCTELTGIALPNTLISIETSAFEFCVSLSAIDIPDSVTHIGNMAFTCCSELKTVKLPKFIDSIPDSLFDGSGVRKLTIGNGIESIGECAFYNCPLTDIYYSGSQSQWKNIEIADGNDNISKALIHYGANEVSKEYVDSNYAPIIENTKTGTIIAVNDILSSEQDVNLTLFSDTVTDFSSVQVKQLGKNLLSSNYPFGTESTKYGITATKQTDGSVVLNGTNTHTGVDTDTVLTDFYLVQNKVLNAGKYYVSGCPDGGEAYTYKTMIIIYHAKGTIDYLADYGISGTSFTAEEGDKLTLSIRLGNKITELNNLIFYPMLSMFQGGYEPYCEYTTITADSNGNVIGFKNQPFITFITNDSNVKLSLTYKADTKGYIDNIEAEGVKGEKGDKGATGAAGEDGYSPTVEVTETESGHTVVITDTNGEHTFEVSNGQDGDKGEDGTSVTHSWNGTTLTITSASGTSSADLKGDKGDTGEQGIQGETGADGYTPVKGTDYFTPADKNELVNSLITETGIDVIPDYVVTEAESVIDEVIAAQGGRTFTFAAMSDMHYSSDYPDGIKHACQALKYIDSRIKLDAVAILGDYASHYLTTDYNDSIADFKAINSLLSGLRFAPNLRQQGNHDFYAVHSPLTHRFIQAQSDDVVWGDKLGGYFYKDFEDYKLRIISVNCNEENGIDENNKPIGNIACSVAQYKWFINSLDLSAKENASEWQILILSHQPLDWYDSDGVYSFAQILNAYKNGISWENSTLGISCDYSGKNAATLIGNIHGHIHNFLTDYIHFGNVANGNKTEIWRMATPEACIGRANQYTDAWHEENTFAKTTGTAQDTSFCIYCIDLDTYAINAICYGAGYNRTLNYSDGTQIITYSITNSLTNVTSDNTATSIQYGKSYSATLTANAEGDMTVTITMGGTDITSDVYADGVISIPEVTGNIVITASVAVEEPTVSYTNQIPISTDTDGSVFNGVGYQTGKRLNSSGAVVDADNIEVTGFIPVKTNDIIRFKNIDFAYGLNEYAYCYIWLYDSGFAIIGGSASQQMPNVIPSSGYFIDNVLNESGNAITVGEQISQFTIVHNADVAYMRISAVKIDGSSIITINQPIE